MLSDIRRMFVAVAAILFMTGWLAQSALAASSQFFGAIQTTLPDGTTVNANHYQSKPLVYLTGGPQIANSTGIPDGVYYFQITNPNGNVLLSNDPAICRQARISGGKFTGVVDPVTFADYGLGHSYTTNCEHATGSVVNANNLSLPIQLGAPGSRACPADSGSPSGSDWFCTTPNNGGVYKVHLIAGRDPANNGASPIPGCNTTIANDGLHLNYAESCTKTDNFKVFAELTCADIPFPAILDHPECFVQMPIRKVVDGRPIDCSFQTDAPGVTNLTVTTVTDTTVCQENPSVIGTMTRVCVTVDDSADLLPPATTCTVTPAYLPQFTTRLYTDVAPFDNLPDNFVDGSCTGTELPVAPGAPGCIGTAIIPPESDPFLPPGLPVVGCEVNISPGWSLPDRDLVTPSLSGVTMVPTPGAPFNPVVYSQAGSPGPTRCFAFVIPPGSTLFEIFINNRPTGNIVVSKLSRGRAGAFTFAGAGSPGDENLLTRAGDCAEKVNGTDLCNGLENAFQINTSAITHTGSYGPRSVDSRTIFDLINNLTPYGVTETGAPLPADLANWVQGALSCTGDNGTPNNLADDHPASPNTAFGVAPNEIVSCKITNSLKACSYTQGAWFAPPKDNNPASLLVTAPIFPLTTGVTRNVQFTAASNVAVASPGGTPGVLGLLSPYVNPLCFAAKTVNKVKCPGTGSGNLGSQTVALKINILMGDNNLLPLAGIGDFILGGLTDADACFNTMTVRNLLTTVLEPVLGGSLAIPSIPCVGGGFYTGNIGTLTVLLGGSLTDTGITGLNPSYDPRNSTTGTVCAPSQWAQDHLF